MAQGISIREFARRENVSDMLVRRAIKQKRLKVLKGGTLNPKLIGTAWRQGNIEQGEQGANTPPSANTSKGANTPRSANTSKKPARGARASKKPAPRPAPDDDETPEEAAQRMIRSGAVTMLPYGQALEHKENYLALLRQLEYEKKSGELVELAVAERVLFEGARAARDAWLNWPARIGPLIAADVGMEADKMTEILTAHVHKHIAQLGDPDVNFSADPG